MPSSLNLVELILAGHLAMLDSVARIFARKILLRFAIGVEDVVDGRIAVAVDRDLIARAVERLHHLDELLPVSARVAAVARIVP